MLKGFWDYIIRQLNIVPQAIYEVLFSLFFVGIVVLLALYGKKAIRYISGLFLAEYLFFIYGLTVIFRTVSTRLSHFFMPFLSYKRLLLGMSPLLYEIVMNVVLFIPVGFLWGTQTTKRTTRQQWLVAFLLGIGLSLGIELLQLAFKKGSFEIDDIIYNTLGCLMGFALWRGLSRLIDVIRKKLEVALRRYT